MSEGAKRTANKVALAIGVAGLLAAAMLWPLAHYCDDRDCGPASIGLVLISVVLMWLQTIPLGGLVAALWSRRRSSSFAALLCFGTIALPAIELFRSGPWPWLALLFPAAIWLAHHAVQGVRAALVVWLVLSALVVAAGGGWVLLFHRLF